MLSDINCSSMGWISIFDNHGNKKGDIIVCFHTALIQIGCTLASGYIPVFCNQDGYAYRNNRNASDNDFGFVRLKKAFFF